jgi:AraC family transcriptional regulator of arabinose operon
MNFDIPALFRPRAEANHLPVCSSLESPEAVASAEQGELAAGETRDHLYLLAHGTIYASPWIITRATSRSPACILLTAQRKPFEVAIGNETHVSTALAIRPLQVRSLRAEHCELVSIMVHPTHPEYRRFCAIAAAGCQALDRDAFNDVDELLRSAYLGQLGVHGAQQLLETVVNIAVRYLPRIRTRDVRCERIVQMLQQNPYCQINELCEAINVAPERMPHLFVRAVGLPWRSFQLWQKVRAVGTQMGSRRSLTQIAITAGFSDSAHLSKTWHQSFGAAPSKFFDHRFVQVHYGLRLEPEPPLRRVEPPPPAVAAAGVCPHCGGPL